MDFSQRLLCTHVHQGEAAIREQVQGLVALFREQSVKIGVVELILCRLQNVLHCFWRATAVAEELRKVRLMNGGWRWTMRV